MAKYVSCDCKCKFNSGICNSNKKWRNKICQCECENSSSKKIIVGTLAHALVRIASI